jgi:hypothetical protein
MKARKNVFEIRRPWWAWFALLLGLLSAGPARSAEMRVNARDIAWVDPRLGRLELTEIAVLPAVAIEDDPIAARLVEGYSALLMVETGHTVLTAPQVRHVMAGAGRRPEALTEAMTRQVWSSGRVDARMAATLARLTGAPALLSVRIDRWEIVDDRAEVELSAALVDSTGRLLWRISGLAADGATQPNRFASDEAPMTAWVGGNRDWAGREISFFAHGANEYAARIDAENRLDPAGVGDRERALRKLVTRWLPAVPPGPGDPDAPGSTLADARPQKAPVTSR